MRNAPLYRNIYRDIRGKILSGELSADMKLGSEKQLAKQYRASLGTVRQAQELLIRENLIEKYQGRGTFVVGAPSQRRQILWVCGADVFTGDISPYYSHFLSAARKFLDSLDFDLVPVWLSTSRMDEFQEYCTPDKLASYAGYMFLNLCCRPGEHPLLSKVIEQHLPYVHVTPEAPAASRVSFDYVQALRLGLGHLAEAGHRKATVVILPHHREAANVVAASARLQLKIIEHPYCSYMSEYVRQGYRIAQDIIADGSLPEALFVMDDIVARGASSAILESQNPPPDMVVLCGYQQMIPFGLPVTFVTDDTVECERQAVRILVEQIHGTRSVGDSYQGKYRLIDGTRWKDVELASGYISEAELGQAILATN